MWLQWRRLWQRGGQCWDVYRRTATASYGAWRRPPSHVVVVALAAIANDSACTHARWLLARTRLRMRARAPTRRLSINLSIRGVLPIHFTTCQHETRRKRRRRIKKERMWWKNEYTREFNDQESAGWSSATVIFFHQNSRVSLKKIYNERRIRSRDMENVKGRR